MAFVSEDGVSLPRSALPGAPMVAVLVLRLACRPLIEASGMGMEMLPFKCNPDASGLVLSVACGVFVKSPKTQRDRSMAAGLRNSSQPQVSSTAGEALTSLKRTQRPAFVPS
mmetsp:Transcript_54966/g.100482  ORF Transcript_54966/g.100482 Transcript_54966/m.100482 type:complete len:112 (-) Transcript_54966:23-358(-)